MWNCLGKKLEIFCGRSVYNFWKFEVLGIYQIGSYFLSHIIIMAEWMKPIEEWNNKKNTANVNNNSEYIFKENPKIGYMGWEEMKNWR